MDLQAGDLHMIEYMYILSKKIMYSLSAQTLGSCNLRVLVSNRLIAFTSLKINLNYNLHNTLLIVIYSNSAQYLPAPHTQGGCSVRCLNFSLPLGKFQTLAGLLRAGGVI